MSQRLDLSHGIWGMAFTLLSMQISACLAFRSFFPCLPSSLPLAHFDSLNLLSPLHLPSALLLPSAPCSLQPALRLISYNILLSQDKTNRADIHSLFWRLSFCHGVGVAQRHRLNQLSSAGIFSQL